jgi:hypothetical protein
MPHARKLVFRWRAQVPSWGRKPKGQIECNTLLAGPNLGRQFRMVCRTQAACGLRGVTV